MGIRCLLLSRAICCLVMVVGNSLMITFGVSMMDIVMDYLRLFLFYLVVWIGLLLGIMRVLLFNILVEFCLIGVDFVDSKIWACDGGVIDELKRIFGCYLFILLPLNAHQSIIL